MSTNPGVTRRPSASISRSAEPSTRPTSVTMPSSIATSAVRAGAPVPSTTVPPRMITSCSLMFSAPVAPGDGPLGPRLPLAWRLARSCSCLSECGEQLAGHELFRRLSVVAVGVEARAGDDEALEAEPGQLLQPCEACVGRPDDGEAVDELWPQRGVVGRGVAQ